MLKDRIIACLTAADRALPAREIANIVYAGDPDGGPLSATETIWSTIRDMRSDGVEIVNWPGKFGGYILGTREDLLYPVSIGSVVAECFELAARRELH